MLNNSIKTFMMILRLNSTGSVPEFRESFDVVNPSLAFPNDVDGFQEAVEKLTDTTLNLCLQILKCLELTLGIINYCNF